MVDNFTFWSKEAFKGKVCKNRWCSVITPRTGVDAGEQNWFRSYLQFLDASNTRVHWSYITKTKWKYWIFYHESAKITYQASPGLSRQIPIFPADSSIYIMTCLPSSRLWRKSSNKQGSEATKGLLANHIVWDFPTLSRNYPAFRCSTHLLRRPDASWIVIQDLGQHQVLIMPYAV